MTINEPIAGGVAERSRECGIENDDEAWVIRPEASELRPVSGAPRLSVEPCKLLQEISVLDENGRQRPLLIPTERPLTIWLDNREIVTLMTLGARPELLVLGYLRNQRLIGEVNEIASVAVDWSTDSASVNSRPHAQIQPGALPAATVRSACGLGTAFGDHMRRIDTAAFPGSAAVRISQGTLMSILDTMRHNDAIHRAAGSVHSCALFRGSDLWVSIEDVSRHNGVDTVCGWMALHGVTGEDKILFTTGRLTGEMVMKAAHNGISILVSRNGVTAMGYEMALKLGMTLFGRAANRRFFCYAGAARFDGDAPAG